MNDFVTFLLKKIYQGDQLSCPPEAIEDALTRTVADVQYHFPQVSAEEVEKRITMNKNELAVFLYRLGRGLYQSGTADQRLLDAVHALMRECCACEIYYSTSIDTGFYVTHGVGTVIGSRHTIGKGFHIYHGCTIGHSVKKLDGPGATIGNDVTMYPGSRIFGSVSVGDKAVLGAGAQVWEDVPEGAVCRGPSS